MKLQSLQLYDFRSFETASVQLHPGVNLIVGENAQGKTNLLESVFYLSTGKSFRTARNQELIRFGAEFADLSCTLFSGGREQSLRAVLFSGRRPRQLYIGGVKQRSAAGLSGVLTTVLFCPDDLLILKAALPETEDSRYRPVPAPARLRAGAGGISEAVRQQIKNFKRLSRRPFPAGAAAGVQLPHGAGRRGRDRLPGKIPAGAFQTSTAVPCGIFRRPGGAFPRLSDRLDRDGPVRG